MTKKTNAARLLDGLHIMYSLHSGPVDEDDLSALAMARALGADPAQLYKTLVARARCGQSMQVVLACIPGPAELDLKKLAQAMACKDVAMVPLKEVQKLTGYLRGGCSPIGTSKPYPVFLDSSAQAWDEIYVSAGQRGLQMLLTPDDLLKAVDGDYADLCRA